MKSRLITIPAALFLVSAGLWAQGPRPVPAPVEPNTIAPVTNINKAGYPRIHEDLSVSFRIVAPAAAKVQIDLCGVKYDMQRSQDGVWTCVTAPQVPGFHYYSIIVDGVSSADPASDSFYGCGRMSSAIEIPEDGTQDFEIQDVPHGQVRALNYYSEVEGGYRPILVYTPAGYDEGKDSYPVVYIHHGGGEDHTGWMDQGRVANIMDNLIARGEAVPMIVVSPNSNVRSVNGGMAGGGYSWNGMQTYRKELIDNIIPFIDFIVHFKAILLGCRRNELPKACRLSRRIGANVEIALYCRQIKHIVGHPVTFQYGHNHRIIAVGPLNGYQSIGMTIDKRSELTVEPLIHIYSVAINLFSCKGNTYRHLWTRRYLICRHRIFLCLHCRIQGT